MWQSLLAQHLELETILTTIEQMAPLPDCIEQRRQHIMALDTALTLLAGNSIDAFKKAARLASLCNDEAMFLLVYYFFEYSRQATYTKTSSVLASACREFAGNGSQSSVVNVFFMWLQGRLLELDSKYEAAEVCLQNALKQTGKSRLITAGILHAKGMIYLRKRDFGKACEFFAQATKRLDDKAPCIGLYSIYLDYALAAMFLKNNDTARQMAHTAASIAVKASDVTGVVASSAHLSVLCAKNRPAAIQFLSRAAQLADQAFSNYEHGLVCYAQAALRRCLDQSQNAGNQLAKIIDQPFSVYCRKGLMLFSMVKNAVEQEQLRKLLSLQ